MTLETLQSFLGWCTLFNVGLLAAWFLFFWLGHDLMYKFHGHLFSISVEKFDAIHYAGMAFYKIGIFLLNLIPYLALEMVG